MWGFKFQRGTPGCVLSDKILMPEADPFNFLRYSERFPRAHGPHSPPSHPGVPITKGGCCPLSPHEVQAHLGPPPHTCVPCGALPLSEADFRCLLWAGLGWAGRTCSWDWWGHTHLGRSQQIPAPCTHPTPHTQGERERKLCFQLSSQTDGRRSNSNR